MSGKDREDMESVPLPIVSFLRKELAMAERSWRTFSKDMVRQEIVKQFEATGAKGEANGLAFAANGIDASITGIKLEHAFLDPVEMMKEARDRRSRQLPEQLREDIDLVRREIGQANRNLVDVRGEAGQARNVAEEAKRGLTSLRRERVADLQDIADGLEQVDNSVSRLISSLGGL